MEPGATAAHTITDNPSTFAGAISRRREVPGRLVAHGSQSAHVGVESPPSHCASPQRTVFVRFRLFLACGSKVEHMRIFLLQTTSAFIDRQDVRHNFDDLGKEMERDIIIRAGESDSCELYSVGLVFWLPNVFDDVECHRLLNLYGKLVYVIDEATTKRGWGFQGMPLDIPNLLPIIVPFDVEEVQFLLKRVFDLT